MRTTVDTKTTPHTERGKSMGYFEEQQSRRRVYEERERQYARRNWRIAMSVYAVWGVLFLGGLAFGFSQVMEKYW